MRKKDLNLGDIILTSNDSGFLGEAISRVTGGRWTHAMMYAGKWRGRHWVLESNYGGVGYSTFKTLKDKEFCVLRSDLKKKTLKEIIKSAEGNFDEPYDYKGLVGYLRTDIFYKCTGKVIRRDKRDAWFCSELVHHHYKHAGGLALVDKPSYYVSPMDLFRSEYLEVMYIGRFD